MTPAEELRLAAAKLRETAATTLPDWYSPDLAEPLALLLEDQAGFYKTYVAKHGANIAERLVWHALTVARLINGGAS